MIEWSGVTWNAKSSMPHLLVTLVLSSVNILSQDDVLDKISLDSAGSLSYQLWKLATSRLGCKWKTYGPSSCG